MEEKKVPALRFRGFDNAWEQRRLGDIGKARSGIAFPDSEQGGREGIPFFKVSDMNLDGNENEMLMAKNYVTLEQIKAHGWTPIEELPAIFFAKVGAAVMLNRKRLCYRPFLLDNNTMAYSLYSSIWNAGFSKALFETVNLVDLVQVGALPSYNASDVEMIVVIIPCYLEQKKLGQYFSQLDHLISLHQRKLEMLKKVKKSMLEKMFPKNDAKVPELRFSDFTDAWEQCKFSDVVEIGSGMDYKHLGIGDIPVYGTGGYMLSVDVALSENNDAIGIGRKGTIDKPYILRAPFWTVDTLFYCIPKYNHNLDFTNCLFQNIDWKNKDESTGVPSLSKVIINNIETSIPSYEEQKKMGEYFKSFDNLIILHQRKLEKLKNIKKSMLEKMFII